MRTDLGGYGYWCPLTGYIQLILLCMDMSLLEGLGITDDTTRPFSIRFVSFDKSRKKGGEIIDLPSAIRVGSSHNQKNNDTIVVKQVGNNHHPHVVHNFLILKINDAEIFI